MPPPSCKRAYRRGGHCCFKDLASPRPGALSRFRTRQPNPGRGAWTRSRRGAKLGVVPPRPRLQGLSLKTQAAADDAVAAGALASRSLFLLHLYAEQQLLSQVRDYTDELSTAIEIAQEQPAPARATPRWSSRPTPRSCGSSGVKDVSIADAADEVQASTNPQNVGKRLVRAEEEGAQGVRGPRRARRRDRAAGEPEDLDAHDPDRGGRPARRLPADHAHPRRLLGPLAARRS